MNRLVKLTTLLLLISILTVNAQFGLGKKKEEKAKNPVPEEILEQQRNNNAGEEGTYTLELSEQDIADMEALIQAAAEDPETIEMIQLMQGELSDELENLSKLPEEEILGGMKQTMDDLLALEILFKDQEKAVEELHKAGMVAEEHLETYRKDPALLEGDMRKSLYFQFVGLSVVGGYLTVVIDEDALAEMKTESDEVPLSTAK